MKNILFLSILFCINYGSAQVKAVTENGDEVILFENKTWDYTTNDKIEEKEISTNKSTFKKSDEASFFLKSKNLSNIGIYLNTKKWTFKKEEKSESEYKFKFKDKDAYGMLIAERIEVPLITLKELALDNARKIAPDIAVSMEEYRIVNGNKVLCMQMDGTTQGIKFSYFGYYYSSEWGSIQFLTYTSQKLINEFKTELEIFLNGLIIKE